MKKIINNDIVRLVVSRLKKRYGNEMVTSLRHSNPWELLVATMLSAQSQDSQVNKITPKMFKRYRTVTDFALLKPVELQRYIKTLGLYRNKSKNIINAARSIKKNFNGKVPNSMEGMLMLPGVGRKTANVVLANAFGIHDGIAIDTHCITVSNRLFLLDTKDPEKIEAELMKYVKRSDWGNVTHLFIALGRDVCTARRKFCGECVLRDICPSSTERS